MILRIASAPCFAFLISDPVAPSPGLFVALVGFFLLVTGGSTVYLLVEAGLSMRKKATFAAVALGSFVPKLLLASHGHNFDVDSYGIVASLVLQGKNVYANTTRYNYAPLWAFILAGLKQISTFLPAQGPETFHLTVAAFLALTDVALAAVLSFKYRYGAGIFLLFCPATILLTGYHSQFDNLALLAGLVSWLIIRRGSITNPQLVAAAGMQGLSLVVKHVLFLLPLWVFFWTRLGSWRKRTAYAAIAYGIFGSTFIPWLRDPLSRTGIVQNVFLYRSEFTYSLSQLIASMSFLALIPKTAPAILTLIWIVILIVAGKLAARGDHDLFPLYLLAMFAFSPALRDQYLAIPLLACAILYADWPSWAFAAMAMLALLSSPYNVFLFPYRCYFMTNVSTQICAAAFFWIKLRRGDLESEMLPARGAIRNSLALGLGSVALVAAIIMIKSFVLL